MTVTSMEGAVDRFPEGITVIVPVYNEADNIVPVLSAISSAIQDVHHSEVLIVDDGSTDGTFQEASTNAISFPGLKVIKHSVNRGLGAAIRTGVRYASFELVVTIDADLSYDIEVMRKLLLAMKEGSPDAVVASPYLVRGSLSETGDNRIAFSRIVNSLYRLVIGSSLSCYTSLARVYKKSSLSQIQWVSNGYPSQAEILARMIWRGQAIREVPAVLRTRRVGQSKMRLGREIRLHSQLLLMLLGARIRGRM